MIVKQLKNPSEEEIQQIAELCSRAFSRSSAAKANLGGNWTLQNEYYRAHARATALEGELHVVLSQPGAKIVSTASWFPPGVYLFGSESQKALGYNDFFEKLSEEAKYWHKVTFPNIVAECEVKLFTEQEISIRWWCFNLATDPKYQGNGFATSLLKVLTEKTDKQDNIIGLVATTDQNVDFYHGLGFRERGSSHVPAPTGDFDIHVMSRDQASEACI